MIVYCLAEIKNGTREDSQTFRALFNNLQDDQINLINIFVTMNVDGV